MSTGYYTPERIASERQCASDWRRMLVRAARSAARYAEADDLASTESYLELASTYLWYAEQDQRAAERHEQEGG